MELSVNVMNAPWSVLDTFDDINDRWNCWKSLFLNAIAAHAPLIKIRSRQQTNRWLSEETRELMKSRNYFMKKYRKTRDCPDWECYRKLRNAVKKSLKIGKRDYFEDMCRDYSKQPG